MLRTTSSVVPIIILLIAGFSFTQSSKEHTDSGCPNGSHRLDNLCYSISSWVESNHRSELYCKSRGGNLAAVKSPKIHMFLQKLRLEPHLAYWIDLNRDVEGQWHYSDGSLAEYFKWAPGRPIKTAVNQKCAMAGKLSNRWYDVDCNDELHYICQFTDTNCDYSKRAPTFDKYCFEISKDMTTYDNAVEECRLKGGNLAKINTSEMYHFVKDMFLRESHWLEMYDDLVEKLIKQKASVLTIIWIGLRYRDGMWVFSDGTTSNFTLWQLNEPNNSQNSEDCVAAHVGWFDANCNRGMQFACEYKVIPSNEELVPSNPRVIVSHSSDGRPINQYIWNIFN